MPTRLSLLEGCRCQKATNDARSQCLDTLVCDLESFFGEDDKGMKR